MAVVKITALCCAYWLKKSFIFWYSWSWNLFLNVAIFFPSSVFNFSENKNLRCSEAILRLFKYHSVCVRNRFSCVRLFLPLWTVARQAPLSMRILQARILEWVATPFSRGSSQPRDQTCVSVSPALAVDSLQPAPRGKPFMSHSPYVSVQDSFCTASGQILPALPSCTGEPHVLVGRQGWWWHRAAVRGDAGGGARDTHGTPPHSTCPTCWRLRLEVLSQAKSVAFRERHLAFWQLHRSSHGCLRVSPACLSHGLDIEPVPGIWRSQFLGMRNEEKLESVCMCRASLKFVRLKKISPPYLKKIISGFVIPAFIDNFLLPNFNIHMSRIYAGKITRDYRDTFL